MAGLRTNALVALGATLFEMLALFLAMSPTAAAEHSIDFTRVTACIVSGVGFLGAGVIIRDGVNVRGINTAATDC
jgi:putative Mg2+ transporter-C (MgtC) family protein